MRRAMLRLCLALMVAVVGCDSDTGTSAADVLTSDTEGDAEAPYDGYRVGAAIVDISPDYPVVMGGYGTFGTTFDTCRTSEGEHDPVQAAVLAIAHAEDVPLVLVGLDATALMLPDIEEIEVRAAALVGGDVHVVLSSSHSHSAPDLVGFYGPSRGDDPGRDDVYAEEVVDAVAGAVADAVDGLVPATLRFGAGNLATFGSVASDANPMATQDQLIVLSATSPEGETIGSATVWASHPTVYGEDNHGLSADYPGTFRRALGEALGGGVHVFLQGPLGGVYPMKPAWMASGEEWAAMVAACHETNPFSDGYQDPDVSTEEHDLVACAGQTLADAVLTAIESAEELSVAPLYVDSATFEIPANNPLMRFVIESGMVTRDIPPEGSDEGVATRTTLARFGPLALVTAPGEAFPRYATALAERVTQAYPETTMVVTIGQGNDALGYLLTPEQFDDDAYGYHRGLSPSRDALARHLAALDTLLGGER